MNLQPPILQDNLIKIVPLSESDFDRLYEVASDPLIWEQHPTKDRFKKVVFQVFFDGAVKSNTAFIIIDKLTDNVIGSTRYYDYKPENNSLAIGYTFFARSHWGGVFNKASKSLLLDYAFQFVDKVYFHVGTTNLRSQRAVLKIGATKLGEVEFDYYGGKLSHYEYLITKREWIT
jgi:RimJ/RimL family protein N-acetyltransferase